MTVSTIPDLLQMSTSSTGQRDSRDLVGVHRRGFLGILVRGLAAGGLASALRPCQGWAASQDGLPQGLGSWVGQALEYKVSCSLVEDFAEGQIWVQGISSSRKYLAVMKTRLQGIVGVLALQRTDLLASLVEWEPDRGRFVPLWHADQVARQGSWRRKVLVFEARGEAYTEHKLGPDGSRKRKVPQQGRPLDDPLSAFLNWRAGVYGPLKPGQTFLIDNLARKDPLALRLRVATEEEARSKRPGSQSDQWAFLLQADLDRELAESLRGSLEGWLDTQWVPLYARANNVRLVGEVWARLSGRWRLLEPELARAPEPPLEGSRWNV